MVVSLAPIGYRLEVSDAERNQLIVAAELALAFRRGDPEARALALDLDDGALDALCDRLVLAGGAS